VLDQLSPRESEVLGLASLGLTNPQIAARLHLSVHAVKFHLAGVYRKLGAANRTEAVVRYLQSAPPAAHSEARS
jgi:DNA-binding CsgD family transcriptional regulator